jgi:hypothetical protein
MRSKTMLRTSPIPFLLLTFAMLLPAEAHVGSPNVFYQGEAGKYQVLVSIDRRRSFQAAPKSMFAFSKALPQR